MRGFISWYISEIPIYDVANRVKLVWPSYLPVAIGVSGFLPEPVDGVEILICAHIRHGLI